ncbi:MAG: serine hydrolase [Actinomycetota bacterium]|nr:serine hydrolase [Actinomycetota bacterium]
MKQVIDSVLQSGVDRGAVAGVTAIVVDRDGVRFEGGFGRREVGGNADMTFDTVGAIFSMTKAITAAAAMQLVEQGRLDLDAPASDVCPAIGAQGVLTGFDADGQPITRPPATPVTLRHLLTHTSGYVYDIWNPSLTKWTIATGAPGVFSLQKAALETPLMFDPGTDWEYGIGIDWAGLMVEAVAGQTLGQYLAEHLTGPLGMSDTTFSPTAEQAARTASLHARLPDGGLTPISLPAAEAPEFEMGGGGLVSTVHDYGRFMRMILNDGSLEGTRVLRAETVQLMSSNNIGDLRVKMLRTEAPTLSADAEFFPGEPKTWGLSFQINEEPASTGRPAGTLMWAGLANSFQWIDRQNGIAGAYLSQILPFADPATLGLYLEMETAVYDSL